MKKKRNSYYNIFVCSQEYLFFAINNMTRQFIFMTDYKYNDDGNNF